MDFLFVRATATAGCADRVLQGGTGRLNKEAPRARCARAALIVCEWATSHTDELSSGMTDRMRRADSVLCASTASALVVASQAEPARSTLSILLWGAGLNLIFAWAAGGTAVLALFLIWIEIPAKGAARQAVTFLQPKGFFTGRAAAGIAAAEATAWAGLAVLCRDILKGSGRAGLEAATVKVQSS